MVHDCFWTHPCDVALMNAVCRDQFIALHSFPILENLSEYFLESFTPPPQGKFVRKSALTDTSQNFRDFQTQKRTVLFQSVPAKGDLDLNVVRDSIYFFN